MPSSRDVKAGGAFIELGLRDKLDAGLKRAQAKLNSFARGAAVLGGALTGFGVSAIAGFAPAISAASGMEETMNKFNVVFGESSGVVKAWSDEFAGSIGRSKKQIADFMAGTQDLLVPLGFGANEATEFSKSITGLAVDLASFNNLSDDAVLRDLHAALTGSGEVMKKYGVIVSEAAVKQELLNQGLDPKAATDQQKVMARMNIILRGTTAAQGDALRSAGSFANQMKALSAAIDDTKVAIGQALLPVVTPLLTRLSQVVKVIGDWIAENQQIVVIMADVFAAITAVGTAVLSLGGLAAAGSVALSGIGTVIGALASPIGAAIAAVVALGIAVGGVAAWLIGVDGLVGAWTSAKNAMSGFLEHAFGFMANFQENMSELFRWLNDAWTLVLGNLPTVFLIVGQNLLNNASVIFNTFMRLLVAFQQFSGKLFLKLFSVDMLASITKGIIKAVSLFQRFADQIILMLAKAFIGQKVDTSGFLTSIAQDMQTGADPKQFGTVLKNIIQEGVADLKVFEGIGAEIGLAGPNFNFERSRAAATTPSETTPQQIGQVIGEEIANVLPNAELIGATIEDAFPQDIEDAIREAATDKSARAAEAAQRIPSEDQISDRVTRAISGSSTGTFSGLAAAFFGQSGGPQDRIAKATEKTADNTADIIEKLDRLEPGVIG